MGAYIGTVANANRQPGCCQVEGWSLTPCIYPAIFFSHDARVERRYIFFQSINFGKLYEIFRGKTWCGFRLAYFVVWALFWQRLMLRNWPFFLDTVPPCQACKFKNFISDFFIGSKSWKASRFSVGFRTSMHVYKCIYQSICIPTRHYILHTAYQRSHYQCSRM